MATAIWSEDFPTVGRPTIPSGVRPARARFAKVPEVTFGFWAIKVLATTLGETGGDAVTMSLGLGYLAGTAIFATLFVALVAAQAATRGFHPFLFWSVIVATTTVGTTLADRSLGIGYVGGSVILSACLLATLGIWYRVLGSVAVGTVTSPKAETFYWVTILFSQTLGTALGDFLADDGGLGYGGGALVFGAALAGTVVLYYRTNLSRVLLFWSAFIMTRPLVATLGDLLDKTRMQGGLALDRFSASAVLAFAMVACVLLLPQRAERLPGPERRQP